MNGSALSRIVVAIACVAIWAMPLFAPQRITFIVAMTVAIALGLLLCRRVRLDGWPSDLSSIALAGALLTLGLLLFRPTVLQVVVAHGIPWRTLQLYAWFGSIWLPPIVTMLSFLTQRPYPVPRPTEYYYDPYRPY